MKFEVIRNIIKIINFFYFFLTFIHIVLLKLNSLNSYQVIYIEQVLQVGVPWRVETNHHTGTFKSKHLILDVWIKGK